MNIVCSQCETTFFLPDDHYKAGRKVRCSICQYVFTLPSVGESSSARGALASSPGPAEHVPSAPVGVPASAGRIKSKLLPSLLLLAILVCCGALGFGVYLFYQAFIETPSNKVTVLKQGADTVATDTLINQQMQNVSRITLKDVRQFILANEKLGEIVVIQGIVVNGFSTPKEHIVVEALLYGPGNTILARQQQVAGPTLSLLQLQSFSQEELTKLLNDKITILTRNTNVQPWAEVPFVIVFPKKPAQLSEFEVRPFDASDPPSP